MANTQIVARVPFSIHLWKEMKKYMNKKQIGYDIDTIVWCVFNIVGARTSVAPFTNMD